ncbi:hypothetical protein N7447_009228, partial [Penicillium robsamsonii]|uniref:uncharacterized protein n=1 Tax=Penicillium robsamsonii TaxID=1792511 RepID=UPI002547310C
DLGRAVCTLYAAGQWEQHSTQNYFSWQSDNGYSKSLKSHDKNPYRLGSAKPIASVWLVRARNDIWSRGSLHTLVCVDGNKFTDKEVNGRFLVRRWELQPEAERVN